MVQSRKESGSYRREFEIKEDTPAVLFGRRSPLLKAKSNVVITSCYFSQFLCVLLWTLSVGAERDQ